MLKKIFSYGFVEGVSKGLNKLTILALPLFIDTISYGKIGLLVSIELIIPVVTLLGLERAVLRFYSQEKEFLGFSKTVFSSVLWVHIFIISILALFYFLGFKTFFGLNVFPDLILILLLIYFQGTNLISLNMMRVNENHKKYFQGRLFIQVSKFIFVITCIYLSKNYLGYIVGAIIASFTANILFRIKKGNGAKKYFHKKTFITLFSFSWPFMFHGLAINLLGNADKFILEKYLSLNEVGLYTLAYSIGSSISFAYIGISVFLEPLIYKEEDDKKREILLNKFLFLTFCFGVVSYIIITLASIYVLPQIYSIKYESAFYYVPYISLALLILPFYLKSNYKMIYEKKSLNIALVSILSAFVNIGLNFIFIPVYGIFAAVFITLISYIFQAVLFVLLSNKFNISNDLIDVLILSIILTFGIFFKLPYFLIVPIIFLYIFFIYYMRIKPKSIRK